MDLLINRSTSELNTLLNPTTYLGDTGCWIQQVTTRVGAVTCWIQQPVSPKQVVGFSCVFNSEVDQLIRESLVYFGMSRSIRVDRGHPEAGLVPSGAGTF